jgi:hypothetical protein
MLRTVSRLISLLHLSANPAPQILLTTAVLASVALAAPFDADVPTRTTRNPALHRRRAGAPSRTIPLPVPRALIVSRETGETVTNSALAVTTINNNDGLGAGKDEYTFFQGDGSTGAGWPSHSDWYVLNSKLRCFFFFASSNHQ